MDETQSDPFDALIRDVASPQGPASSDGQNPPANAAGAPNAGPSPQAEGGAKPGAQEQSTANPAVKPPDQGLPAGMENPTDPAAADAAAAGKGSLPEYLKPFETTLKSKGFDLSKPEGVAKVLQWGQEAESTLGRRTTEANLLLTRAQEIEKDFQAGPDGVNRRLEAMGFSKLDVPTPENRLKELKSIYSAVSVIADPNATAEQRNAAIEGINALVFEPMDDLRINLAANKGKGTAATAQLKDYRTKSYGLFNDRVAQNPELHTAYDAILPAFQPGGVFHSFGLDHFSMTSSPERAAAIEQIGQALHFKESAFNPDGSVKDGGPIDVEIKKALALANRGGNAGPAGNGNPPVPGSNGNQNSDPIGDMLNSWARDSAMA
ncbi:MAG: hypothetical protein ABIY63_13390 [Fibrobacteria bacterium]